MAVGVVISGGGGTSNTDWWSRGFGSDSSCGVASESAANFSRIENIILSVSSSSPVLSIDVVLVTLSLPAVTAAPEVSERAVEESLLGVSGE